MAVKPVYEFEDSLLSLRFKIFPAGKKYKLESESFPNFAHSRYDSIADAKRTLQTIIMTRYSCEQMDSKKRLEQFDSAIKNGQSVANNSRSVDSWLERINRAHCEF